jgi:mono/diheme cytochrome c family protein
LVGPNLATCPGQTAQSAGQRCFTMHRTLDASPVAASPQLPAGRVGVSTRPVAFRRVAIRFSTLLIALFAATRLPGEWQPSEGTVALYVSFQTEMPAASVKAMRDELDWITSPVGVKFAWRTFHGVSKHAPVARLAVVHFKGSCNVEDLTLFPPNSFYRWKLGWTHAVDGRIVPYADIFCDAIRAYIAPTLLVTDEQQRELYHVFAETRNHAWSGLAKANCSEGDLVSDDYSFGSNELRKLRTILAETMVLATSSQFPLPPGKVLFASNGCIGCHGPQGNGTRTGPLMEASHIPRDVEALKTRLRDSSSIMHKRARDLKLSWKDIGTADLGKLLNFIRTSAIAGASMRAVPAN